MRIHLPSRDYMASSFKRTLCVALSKTDPVQLFRRTQSFWWRWDFWLNGTFLSAVAERLYLIKVSKCSLGHKKYEQKFFPFIPTCRNHSRMQWRFFLRKDQGQQYNKDAHAELPWGQVTQLSRSGEPPSSSDFLPSFAWLRISFWSETGHTYWWEKHIAKDVFGVLESFHRKTFYYFWFFLFIILR